MGIVTLTTDFGLSDPYVAAMKGVMLSLAPGLCIVDVSHEVPPQDIDRAAWVLGSAYALFPEGTVHVAVVDPGVGGARRVIAVQAGPHRFLAPDNGVLKRVFDAHPDAQVYAVTRSEYFRDAVSRTFHGRDVFAPVAARLAQGLPPARLGDRFDGYERGRVASPRREKGRITGEIAAFDRFGNAVSNIPGAWFGEGSRVRVLVRGREIGPLSMIYRDVPPGEALALVGSADTLELSVNRGSAREALGLALGDEVLVLLD
jgi:hypothetical protein